MFWPNGTKTRPTISSPFNPARKHPVTGVTQPHRGVDLIGFTQVRAIADGTVAIAGASGGAGGTWVHVNHGNGVVSNYQHLRAGSVVVRVGQQVKAGDVLGVMGMTGTATGVHLHLEVRVSGTATDPVPYVEARLESTAGGGTTPLPTPTPDPEEPEMNSEERAILNAIRDQLGGDNNRKTSLRQDVDGLGRDLATLQKAIAALPTSTPAQRYNGPVWLKHGDVAASSPLWMYILPTGDYVRVRDPEIAGLYKEINGGIAAQVVSGKAMRRLRDDLEAAGGRDITEPAAE